MQIRNARLNDAGALIELFAELAGETEFMQFELADSSSSLDEQECDLSTFIASTIPDDLPDESPAQVMSSIALSTLSLPLTQVMFVIEDQGGLLGFAVGVAGYVSSNPQSLGLVMGIRKAQQGLGLGRQLLVALEAWSRLQDFAALELTMMAHNHRAVRLYQSAGFTTQGRRSDAFELDGLSVDELYMYKILPR